MTETQRYWLLFVLASLTYLITLFSVQYTGEEAVYTLGAYEMWAQGHFLYASLYGSAYGRPPLINWLILFFSLGLGWDHVLIAARLVSALATIGSGLLVGFAAQRIWKNPERGALAALVFITFGDILLYYGWLAYSDALFAFFALASMLCAWLWVREGRVSWLIFAALAVMAGFLTKALTAFVFYGVALAISLWMERGWVRLRSPLFWVVQILTLCVPLVWYRIGHAGTVAGTGMAHDIAEKLQGVGAVAYLGQLTEFPAKMLVNLLPWSAILLWLRWREGRQDIWWRNPNVRLAAAIGFLNFLPYWLAPQSSLRYVLPIYGLIALAVAARLDWSASTRTLVIRGAYFAIALKLVAALWLFPAYTHRFRPDLAAIAHDMEQRTKGYPLYSSDRAWIGISVTTIIDIDRSPGPIILLPRDMFSNGFLISENEDRTMGKLVHDYHGVVLLCRGAACTRGSQ